MSERTLVIVTREKTAKHIFGTTKIYDYKLYTLSWFSTHTKKNHTNKFLGILSIIMLGKNLYYKLQ